MDLLTFSLLTKKDKIQLSYKKKMLSYTTLVNLDRNTNSRVMAGHFSAHLNNSW